MTPALPIRATPQPTDTSSTAVTFEAVETFSLTAANVPGIPLNHAKQHFTCITRASSSSTTPSLLFAGTSLGKLYLWRILAANKYGVGARKRGQEDLTDERSKTPHKGPVQCMVYCDKGTYSPPTTPGLLFTGGGDRTIKIWDIWSNAARSGSTADPCLQTLTSHTHTVTSLVTSPTHNTLFSTSLDRTLKQWTLEPSRTILLNPFFVCSRTFSTGDASYYTASCLREGEDWALFAPGSDGSLSVYSNLHNHSASLNVGLSKRYKNIHSLAISSILLVASQNFVVTASFDGGVTVLDCMTGNVFLAIQSKNRTRYTGMCWDDHFDQLLLVDEQANLEAWNVYRERLVGGENVMQIKSGGAPSLARKGMGVLAGKDAKHAQHTAKPLVETLMWVPNSSADSDNFVMCLPNECVVEEWTVKRDLGCKQFVGHEDKVVGIVVVVEEEMKVARSSPTQPVGGAAETVARFRPEESAIFSCSLDNTVRCWDDYDVQQRFQLKETGTEISALGYVSRFNFIVTGGDDGSLKFWNPDSGHCHVERCHDNTVTVIETAVTDRMELVLTASYDGTICVFDVRKKKIGAQSFLERKLVEEEDDEEGEGERKEEEKGETGGLGFLGLLDDNSEILALHYHTETDVLACAGNSKVIKAWNCLSGELVCKWESDHSESITCLAGDGSYLFSGSEDGTIGIWNLGEEIDVLAGNRTNRGKALMSRMRRMGTIQVAEEKAINALCVMPQSGYLVSADGGGDVKVWDYTKVGGAVVKVIRHHDEIPTCLAIKEGTECCLFVGTKTGSLLKCDVEGGEVLEGGGEVEEGGGEEEWEEVDSGGEDGPEVEAKWGS